MKPKYSVSPAARALGGQRNVRLRKDPIKRFWSKVDIKGPNDCWEWYGPKDSGGYGHTCWFGKTRKAHRISWVLANGRPVPRGLYILHSCDNRPCVNPRHLRPGTQKENCAEMVQKGRCVRPRGEAHNQAKLTEVDVKEIRTRRAQGDSRKQLAKDYNVDPTLIWLIVRRKIWKHVT